MMPESEEQRTVNKLGNIIEFRRPTTQTRNWFLYTPVLLHWCIIFHLFHLPPVVSCDGSSPEGLGASCGES